MSRCIEKLDLFRLQSLYRISIHRNQNGRVSVSPANTGTGNIMRLLGQVLRNENLLPCLDYSGIIHIYILDKEPSADAIGG